MPQGDKITFKNLGVILEDHETYFKLYSLDMRDSITWACYDRTEWFDRLVKWNNEYNLSFSETLEKIKDFC